MAIQAITSPAVTAQNVHSGQKKNVHVLTGVPSRYSGSYRQCHQAPLIQDALNRQKSRKRNLEESVLSSIVDGEKKSFFGVNFRRHNNNDHVDTGRRDEDLNTMFRNFMEDEEENSKKDRATMTGQWQDEEGHEDFAQNESTDSCKISNGLHHDLRNDVNHDTVPKNNSTFDHDVFGRAVSDEECILLPVRFEIEFGDDRSYRNRGCSVASYSDLGEASSVMSFDDDDDTMSIQDHSEINRTSASDLIFQLVT